MGNITNDFSWSRSKAKTFHECPRAIYYKNYKSWGGWDAASPSPVRQAYTLKNLTSVPAWIGSHVHGGIERALLALKRSSTLVSDQYAMQIIESTIQEVTGDMRNEARLSAAGKYKKAPKKIVGLIDHDRGGKIDIDRAINDVETQLRSFFGSYWWTKLRTLPVTFPEIEELVELQVDGIKCFLKIDALFSSPLNPVALVDGESAKMHVVDWKTGKSLGADREQMAFYVLYVTQRYGVDPGDVAAIIYNVRLDLEKVYRFASAELDALAHGVRADAELMSKYLVHGDRARNEPLPENQWPLAEEGSRACDWCEFRDMCPRFMEVRE